jgi:hypothetical protein
MDSEHFTEQRAADARDVEPGEDAQRGDKAGDAEISNVLLEDAPK